MSTLNLTPNPIAVATQAIIFFTNLFIIKKLMLEPYLRRKDLRDSATVGSQASSRALAEASEKMTGELTHRIQKAHEGIKEQMDGLRKVSVARKQEVVGAAEKQAKDHVQQIHVEITKGLAEERAKLAASARLLAGQLLDKALN